MELWQLGTVNVGREEDERLSRGIYRDPPPPQYNHQGWQEFKRENIKRVARLVRIVIAASGAD